MLRGLPTGVETRHITTRETNIRILVRQVSSARPWVILSPGQGDSAESMLPLFESSMNHNINIVVFDPPGHGLSDEPLTDYSVKSQRIIWESVFDYLSINRAYIGGYSYGAYSAAMCGELIADRVAGLVLIEGGYLTMKQKGATVASETKEIIDWMNTLRFGSWDEAIESIRSQAHTWSDWDTAELYTSMVERDGVIEPRTTEKTIQQMEQTLGEYSTVVLREIKCPILLLHATLPIEKEDMRESGLASFRSHASHAKIVAIPNCGHTIKEHLHFVMTQLVEFINHADRESNSGAC